jgi:glycerol-3-phosphate dehydrogenase (NAD(P)+)
MGEQIAVLGAGNMGTAVAQVVASNGHRVRLWSIEHDVLEEIRDRHLNTKYLDDVRLNDGITAAWEMSDAVAGAAVVVVSVPSQVVRGVARELAPHLSDGQIVLDVAKGLEGGSHKRMSEVLGEELGGQARVVIGSMGGPAIAIEMARGQPLAVIVGMPDEWAAGSCQRLLQNEHLKVETTSDVDGLELCATLKNVYAIALGICDGLGYGANTKAFVASLALGEMAAIAEKLGGARATAYGLAGIGDLLTTGYSEHSRNRTLGEKLGANADWEHFLRTHTVEGVGACRSVREMTGGALLATPLLDAIYSILYDGQPAPGRMRRFFTDFAYGI